MTTPSARASADVGVVMRTISQPAVSQHLDRLKKAGFVTVASRGASHVYSATPDGPAVIRAWLDRYWSGALDNYQRILEQEE